MTRPAYHNEAQHEGYGWDLDREAREPGTYWNRYVGYHGNPFFDEAAWAAQQPAALVLYDPVFAIDQGVPAAQAIRHLRLTRWAQFMFDLDDWQVASLDAMEARA